MPPDINAVIHKYGGDGFVVLVLSAQAALQLVLRPF